jgi:large subunit ribosomal protein L21
VGIWVVLAHDFVVIFHFRTLQVHLQDRLFKFRFGGRGAKERRMYAVIRTGGKQYRVAPGDILEVEKLDGNVGDSVSLGDVLMIVDDVNVTIGQPQVDGATVTAKITGQHRGEKIMVFRYRPKKRIRVRRGHRQYLTRLQIETIQA